MTLVRAKVHTHSFKLLTFKVLALVTVSIYDVLL